ncbi:MAG TPA: protein phosphatase 2C domain-containing protein [Candidatus Lumbricidophila sp.]|nr:protein phosphatase 2C domain-containing protein [Candidatus Lumbricidophila sp.]
MTQIGTAATHQRCELATGAAVTLSWSAISDTGHRREANEDSFVAVSPVFAVADGMGGHRAGDLASAAVVTRLAEHGGASVLGIGEVDHALQLAVEDMGRNLGITDSGSGTTVTGVGLAEVNGVPSWLVFNIGDSRVYLLHGGVLEQLTVDHSVVQELVDAGEITHDEAETHPHGNVITRAVGFHELPIPDYRVVAIEPGMRVLVCSDGLTKELTGHGIRHYLASNSTAAAAADELVAAALGNGGRDNVTVIVLDVLEVENGEPAPAV